MSRKQLITPTMAPDLSRSGSTAYDFDKYSSLAGYAADVLEVMDHVAAKG